MFTTGHYKIIAHVVNSCPALVPKDELLNHLVLAFHMDNARFDEAKFRKACDMDANKPAMAESTDKPQVDSGTTGG